MNRVRFKKNKQPKRVGEKHNRSKLKDVQVVEIKQLIAKDELTLTQIASQFGVTLSNISLIKRGKAWSHLNIEKQYENKNNIA